VVDWFEVWSREYWREYLGTLGGDAVWLVQRLCARLPQRAFCFSRLYAARLRDEGLRGEVTMLAGVYSGSLERREIRPAEPLIVFAGRHIPEKQVPAILPALVHARARIPDLRASILGDGPERDEVLRLAGELGLQDAVDIPGFVPSETVDEEIARALCLLLPSRREGYGLVIIEAAAAGTPSVVVAGSDNAAVELIAEGENGFIAPSAAPDDLAAAILRVHDAGPALRASTAAWFERHAARLSLAASLEIALDAYGPVDE
jgi:glycosyltransferase involved in cell wall biosynthesis